MFHAVADDYWEIGSLQVPECAITKEEIKEWGKQNYWETVQILAKHDICPDVHLGRVYIVCMTTDMENLNYAFPLKGPDAMAPIPWSLKRERGKPSTTPQTQMSTVPAIAEATGYQDPSAHWTSFKAPMEVPEPQATTPSPKSSFARDFKRLRNEQTPTLRQSNKCPDGRSQMAVVQTRMSCRRWNLSFWPAPLHQFSTAPNTG